MTAPHPLPAAALVAQRLLEIEDPDEAGATMLKILAWLRDDLVALAWAESDANGTSLRFGREVTSLLAAIRDRHAATTTVH